MARFSYGEPIRNQERILQAERDENNKIVGKGKIALVPSSSYVLIDEDGLTVRNNSLQNQRCGLSKNIIEAIKGLKDNFYWEVTVVSLRYTKVGYSMKGEEIMGYTLPVTRNNQTFGFVVDVGDKKFKIYSNGGLIEQIPIVDKYKLHPSVEIGPLQQVMFNVGKAKLRPPGKCRILSDVPCSSIVEKYTCDEKTFRQSISLPFMQSEYNVDIGQDKKKGEIVHGG